MTKEKRGGFLSTNQATIYGCYLGYVVQGIINNINPILFVTYQTKLGVSIEAISILIISVNASNSAPTKSICVIMKSPIKLWRRPMRVPL